MEKRDETKRYFLGALATAFLFCALIALLSPFVSRVTEGRDADHLPVVQEVKGGKFVVFGE